jgi:hypothetical protein
VDSVPSRDQGAPAAIAKLAPSARRSARSRARFRARLKGALVLVLLTLGWQLTVAPAQPHLSLVGVAHADDDDRGGRAFRGRRGGRLNAKGILTGVAIARALLAGAPRFRSGRYGSRRAVRLHNRPAMPIAASQRSRRELIVAGLTADGISSLQARGYDVSATRASETLGKSVSLVVPPRRIGDRSAVRDLRLLGPDVVAARNDTFRRSAIARYKPMGEACGAACEAFVMTGWQPTYLRCARPETIGVIDTAVDPAHPSLAGASVELASVRRQDQRPSNPAHGTGVVSLLVGQPGSGIVGVVPRAKVVAVDAFYRSGDGDSTNAYDIVAALDHLAERKVRIVNLSLAGPENEVLAASVTRLIRHGTTLIAAAGPASGRESGYPAKYPGVIAVAAVDTELRPSRLSARGVHIAYAGPGVGMPVASPGGSTRLATGTSFAAPIVAAAFATAKTESGGDRMRTMERMQSLAKDLGPPGRDPVFGWGLVQFPVVGGC